MKLKTQMVILNEDDSEELCDFYLESERIDCFYIATASEEFGGMVNVFINGECFSLKQEPHVTDHLMELFVKPSLKNKKASNDE